MERESFDPVSEGIELLIVYDPESSFWLFEDLARLHAKQD